MEELISQLSASACDPHAESPYSYPACRAPLPIGLQIAELQKFWPLNPQPALRYMREMYGKKSRMLRGLAEGPFAVVRPGAISNTYNGALSAVMSALHRSREGRILNHWGGSVHRINLGADTAHAFAAIESQQKDSDILIVPAQLGLLRAGISLEMILNGDYHLHGSEFMLDPLAGLCAILTHSHRFAREEDLGMDFAGAICDPSGNGAWDHVPSVKFVGNCLVLSTGHLGQTDESFGISTGFTV
jgi:hypothetical protein